MRPTETNALEALFPGCRRLVLGAIFHEPQRWWSIPELAGRAGMQPASLRQYLSALRSGGVVREKAEEGRAWFQANASCPIFGELESILNKLASAGVGAETILVVEDQPATAQITRILLESWGYRVVEAHSGAEALSVFERDAETIQLLLTDIIMPGLSGPQLADELLSRKPALRVVFMSGYCDAQNAQPGSSFLPKPFNPASLSRTIRKELDRRSGAPAAQMNSS
jgi:CheY-like chemotaxis protein